MKRLQIKSIEFRNLFSYGNKWTYFSPSGLCYITGQNVKTDRRNFTGKSNLLKVYPYSLFGKVEGLNKGRIINWKNRKNAESKVTLTKGDDEYIIHRGIKPDILQVYENGSLLPEPPNKKDFQTQIEREILEMDYATFMNVVYADTNNSMSMLRMGKPVKRKFLEQLFDLEYFTDMKEKVNQKLNKTKTKISNVESSITQKEQSIDHLLSEKTKYGRMLNEVEDSTQEYENISKKILDLKERSELTSAEIIRLKEKESKIDSEKSVTSNVLTRIDLKIKDIRRNKIKKIQIEVDIENTKKKLDDLRSRKIEKNDIISTLLEKDSDNDYIEELTDKKWKFIKILATKNSETDQKEKEIKKTKSQISNKTTEDTCPTCYQKVDHDLIESHLSEILHDLEKELEVLKKEVVSKEKEQSENNVLISEYEDTKKKCDQLKKDIEEIDGKIVDIQKDIEKYEKAKKDEKHNKIYENVIGKLQKTREKYDLKRRGYEQEKTELATEIEKNQKILDEFEDIKRRQKTLAENMEKEKKQRESIQKLIQENETNKKNLTKEISDDKKSIQRMKIIHDHLLVLKDFCSDEKVKQYAISNKIPLLNKNVNLYLSEAGVRFYVKLDNWLEVEIMGPGIKDCVYDNLSGAEKISLDRSLQFAFSDLNNMQSSTAMDLLVLDEILDSSVDPIGLKNIMNIVKKKQEEDESNVLIVSHRESFGEMNDFIDEYYCVMYNGSYSKIEKIGG